MPSHNRQTRNRRVIVVFEPKWREGGHHPSWALEICARLLLRGRSVALLCPDPESLIPALKERVGLDNLSRFRHGRITDIAILREKHTSAEGFAKFCALRYAREFLAAKIRLGLWRSVIYFGLLDVFVGWHRSITGRALGRLFLSDFSGVYFFPQKVLDPAGPVELFSPEHYGFFRAGNCKRVIVLSDSHASDLGSHLVGKVACLPDFVPTSRASGLASEGLAPEAERLLKRAGGRKIVMIIGDLHPRKGLCTFLRTARQALKEPWLFYAAGVMDRSDYSSEDLELIESAGRLDNVMMEFGRIRDDQTFSSVLACATVLYACYIDFPYSSNMIAQAAAHRIPLLVAHSGVMRERVEHHQLGEYADPMRPDQVLARLKKMIEAPPAYLAAVEAGARQYLEYHNPENFVKMLESFLLGDSS